MRTTGGIVLALVSLLAASARAQTEPGVGVSPPGTEPPPELPPPNPQPEPPAPETTAPPAAVVAEETPMRPEGRAIGIGAGWVLGSTNLEVPNTVSARLRFANGITIEPSVVLTVSSTSTKDDFGGVTSENTTSGLDVLFGTDIRFPLADRGRFEFDLIGGGSFGYDRTKSDPDGPMNESKITTFTMGLDWGIGISWYIKRNFTITLDALNPVLTYSRTKRDDQSFDETTSSLSAGAVFDPTIRLMVHLYY